jgi:hypothetical protein
MLVPVNSWTDDIELWTDLSLAIKFRDHKTGIKWSHLNEDRYSIITPLRDSHVLSVH